MKAITREVYGSFDVLEIKEIEKPVPQDHEILVNVHATTVNRTDCAIVTGSPFIMRFFTGLFKPKSIVPGTDFAGRVEAVGKDVTTFKPEDRVWGFDDNGLGSQAQYMALSADKAISIIPDGLSFEQAAASAEGAHYAYNFINKVELEPGKKVLVNGATGAIGSAAVQFLKYNGMYVTAVCKAEHFDLVRSLGADKLIDYLTEDFTQDHETYDFVFDAVGKSTFTRCKKLLNPKGIYISSELGPYIQNPFLAIFTPLTGGKKVIFPFPRDIKSSLTFINMLIEKGKFQAVIDKSYPMEQAIDAYKYVASGQKTGNVLISYED